MMIVCEWLIVYSGWLLLWLLIIISDVINWALKEIIYEFLLLCAVMMCYLLLLLLLQCVLQWWTRCFFRCINTHTLSLSLTSTTTTGMNLISTLVLGRSSHDWLMSMMTNSELFYRHTVSLLPKRWALNQRNNSVLIVVSKWPSEILSSWLLYSVHMILSVWLSVWWNYISFL